MLCYIQEINLKYSDSKAKNQRNRQSLPDKMKPKNAEIIILMSNKAEFKPKTLTEERMTLYNPKLPCYPSSNPDLPHTALLFLFSKECIHF